MAAASLGKMGKLDAICARLKLTQKVSSDDGVGGGDSPALGILGKQDLKGAGVEVKCQRINGEETISESGADACDSSVGERNGEQEVKITKAPSMGGEENGSVAENVGHKDVSRNGLKFDAVEEDSEMKEDPCSKNSVLNNSNNNNIKTIDYNNKELTIIPSMQEDCSDNVSSCLSDQSVSSTTVESKIANNNNTNNNDNDHINTDIEIPPSSSTPEGASISPSQPSSNVRANTPNPSSPPSHNPSLLETSNAQESLSPSSSLPPKPPTDNNDDDQFATTVQEKKSSQEELNTSNTSDSKNDVDDSTDNQRNDLVSSGDVIENTKVEAEVSAKEKVVTNDNINLPCVETRGMDGESNIAKTGSCLNVDNKEKTRQQEDASIDSHPSITEAVDVSCENDHVSTLQTSNESSELSHNSSNMSGTADKELVANVTPMKTIPQPTASGTSESVESSSGSGRRKSRKAAKPIKQVGGRYFVDADADFNETLFPHYDKSTDLHLSSTVETSPLDLSASPTSAKDTGSPDAVLNLSSSSSIKGTESSYSNTLVDYAKNTMSELLGIYGFEGSEAKNLTLGKMLLFPEGKQRKVERQTNRPKGGVAIKRENDLTLESVDAPVRSGPFRKKVYTSLTHPNIDNGQNGHIIKAPSPPLSTPVLSTGTTANATGHDLPNSKPSSNAAKTNISSSSSSSSTHTKRHYTTKTFSSSDFHKYIRRYANGRDCGGEHCQDLGYRDHYHCLDCPTKVFIRKEEMVRHFKWHKKRQDSLQHGFMRYSPVDDCSLRFGPCTHNGRQTHYHCVQRGCDKVYVSTSDVQMHANFHRKDSAIIQEGFQRFRATEDCGTTYCAFYGQRTTHFHCRRPQCNFTFKNKSDMEKHKSYHQKDEVLSRDGFKKFMKYETCQFAGCGYSKVSNHIHCIRPGCHYVLHSTAQLYSHKRKHERRDFENAYQRYNPAGGQQRTSTPFSPQERKGAIGGISPNSFAMSDMMAGQGQGKLTSLPLSMTSGVKPESELIQKLGILPNELSTQTNAVSNPAILSMQRSMNVNPQSMSENMLALNLTKKENGQKTCEDDRQTMALPLNLKKQDVTNSVDMEEAEDLSLHGKKKDLTKENILKEALNLKTEPVGGFKDSCEDQGEMENTDEDETKHAEQDYYSDDFDDDDDDDDDDDKDYTQVEEPTLVNGFPGSMDDEKDMYVNGKITAGDSDKEEADEIEVKKETLPHVNQADFKLFQKVHQQVTQSPMLVSNSKAKGQAVGTPISDKKERDEFWKKYLIRYTANDACFSRCACLYKDHYHCRVESCQVIFKSKDGVRGHARFHELQDSITPLVYTKIGENCDCGHDKCTYSQKETHYHCNWTNCNQVIPENGPTFSLLEHYRIHNYGMTYVNKGKTATAPAQHTHIELDPLQKRRGRPPKYAKYDRPVVPKVHLTEKEILDSTLAFMHNKYSKNSTIINGFKKFEGHENCPDDNCMFQGNIHFHCGRKFCHMSTDRQDFLNLHAKDFHNNITILDGYEFFERVVDCRRPHCHNNRINRHFHCIRPRCDYSFVRHSTMSQHNRKHPTAMAAVLHTPPAPTPPIQPKQQPNNLSKRSAKTSTQHYVPIAPAVAKSPTLKLTTPLTSPPPSSTVNVKSPLASPIKCLKNQDNATKDEDSNVMDSKTVIKSAGTFFPLSGIPNIQLMSNTSQEVSTGTSSQQTDISITSETAAATAQQNLTTKTLQSASATAGQLLTTATGAQLINPSVMGLSIPANMVPASIPILAQTSQQQQPSILTGLIPVGNLGHQAVATPQLLNIPGAQIISTSQGQFLQTLGTNMVHLIQNQVPVLNTPTSSGTAAVVPTLGSATTQPLTILLHQPGVSSPLSWANLKKRMHYPIEANCGRPFCKLKKKDHFHCLDCNQAFSDQARLRVHIGKHGFKFKKSDQNGKVEDNNPSGFTYVQSHGVDTALSIKKQRKMTKLQDIDDNTEEDKLSSSLNLQLSAFTDMVTKGKETEAREMKSKASTSPNEKITLVMSNVNSQWTIGKGENSKSVHKKSGSSIEKEKAADTSSTSIDTCESDEEQPSLMIDDGIDESNDSLNDSSSSLTLCSSLSRKSGRKRSLVKNDDFVNSDTLIIPKAPKQRKLSGKRDSDLPAGYKRVKCGEDCGYMRCSYRQTVTHFHCLRADCGYGFSDKSRIMQHSIRHDRLDKLMGGEFQQFRASVSCHWEACEFDEKASHFHCLKCPFACADSSKVPPHRKHHTKLDNISSNGFIKFVGTADCQTAACAYFRKQTHYHCSYPGCNHSVLGPSQMAPHKLKHSTGK